MAAGIRALGVALRALRRVLRVALVTWVFPLSGTWDTLMVIYPVTWSFMIVAMLVSVTMSVFSVYHMHRIFLLLFQT